MVKKIVLGTALIGLVGILIIGAANRTMSKTNQASESHEDQGHRQGRGQTDETANAGETWMTWQGTVVVVDEETVTVTLATGEEVLIEGRSRSFAQERSFSFQNGDQLELTGFYDADVLEVAQIHNLTTDQNISLRGETGRPLWAGRGS